MYQISDKCFIITGGLGGIGLAIADALLKKGVGGVALFDLPNTNRDNLLKSLTNYNEQHVIHIPVDITEAEQRENALVSAHQHFRKIDVIINAAGIFQEDDRKRMIDVNLQSAIEITTLALDKYLSQDGIIVNIASIAAFMATGSIEGYAASKAGLLMYSAQLAQTLNSKSDNNRRIMVVCPGATESPLLRKSIKFPAMQELVAHMSIQQPSYIGNSIINVLETGNNGSIWVMEDYETYEIILPLYKDLKRK